MARPTSLQATQVPCEAGSIGASTRRLPACVKAGGKAAGLVRRSSRLLTRRRRPGSLITETVHMLLVLGIDANATVGPDAPELQARVVVLHDPKTIRRREDA